MKEHGVTIIDGGLGGVCLRRALAWDGARLRILPPKSGAAGDLLSWSSPTQPEDTA